MKKHILFVFLCFNILSTSAQEQYRPSFHFTPKTNWMNDPNGLIYYKNQYHLFYQYHPYSAVWGPMHWGHAISKDLIHWEQLPIALYPDSLGTIFSGSAVIDQNNTSGFGKKGQTPMVAIFTQHSMEGERAGRNDFQQQSIAYSLDKGKTWTKYAGNPVIKNPGLKDFRDPKVFWFAPTKKWIMSLAVYDHIEFYSSSNLKQWDKESAIGYEGMGVHDGNWECPDLFPLDLNGKTHWVLLVSVNPGAPNKGSGTMYFIGDFDGHHFTPYDKKEKWLDYGPDNYASVSYSNTGKQKTIIGWMSNWNYAQNVPTTSWRSTMTLPRNLTLVEQGKTFYLKSTPTNYFQDILANSATIKCVNVIKGDLLSKLIKQNSMPSNIQFEMEANKDMEWVFSNDMQESLIIGYKAADQRFYINRTHSGNISFDKIFPSTAYAPRISKTKKMQIQMILDKTSVELFADGGLTLMTSLFFPTKPYDKVQWNAANSTICNLRVQIIK